MLRAADSLKCRRMMTADRAVEILRLIKKEYPDDEIEEAIDMAIRALDPGDEVAERFAFVNRDL